MVTIAEQIEIVGFTAKSVKVVAYRRHLKKSHLVSCKYIQMYFQYLKGMTVLLYRSLGFRKYLIWPLVLMIFSDRSTFVSGNWFRPKK